jgi:hypothetical protein
VKAPEVQQRPEKVPDPFSATIGVGNHRNPPARPHLKEEPSTRLPHIQVCFGILHPTNAPAEAHGGFQHSPTFWSASVGIRGRATLTPQKNLRHECIAL